MGLRNFIKTTIHDEYLNEDTTPIKNIKVYHSTNDKFEDFSLDHAWDGFWFTDSINAIKKGEVGASGDKYIMTRYITLKKPAGWNEYDKYSIGELINMGYDGVVLPEDDRTDYLVFHNNSISKPKKVANEDVDKSSREKRLNENLTIVYRCIDGNWNKNYDKIEFFSMNCSYAKKFGDKCYIITLDTGNYKILNLKKWNKVYSEKTGKNGNRFNRIQGLFIIGAIAINSNYNEELELFTQALGEDMANQFLSELNNCDAIYGEDAGYVGEFVFAVKNKNMIVNVETLQ